MTALLGLLAVAGYQNRDKIADIFRGVGQDDQQGRSPPLNEGSLGGLLGRLGSNLGGGGASAGGLLSGGLRELIDHFTQNGHGDAAESWVGTGDNKHLDRNELQQAIGPDVLETLSAQTGLSQNELLARLSRELPNAVDRYTPQGRVPSEAEHPHE